MPEARQEGRWTPTVWDVARWIEHHHRARPLLGRVFQFTSADKSITKQRPLRTRFAPFPSQGPTKPNHNKPWLSHTLRAQ